VYCLRSIMSPGVIMDEDLLFETNRFNLSEVKEHFINPCCFGEDLANWLRAKLSERGIEVDEPGQEDWGWYVRAKHGECWYFLGMSGNADESGPDKDEGEWRIMVEEGKWQFPGEGLWQRLRGKTKNCDAAVMKRFIFEILEREPDFRNVRYG